ncbi:hypothetical protein EWB00_000346, partial [Schistosoma japonicum]
ILSYGLGSICESLNKCRLTSLDAVEALLLVVDSSAQHVNKEKQLTKEAVEVTGTSRITDAEETPPNQWAQVLLGASLHGLKTQQTVPWFPEESPLPAPRMPRILGTQDPKAWSHRISSSENSAATEKAGSEECLD